MAPNEITEFLTSRRAAITPDQAGLPSLGTRRVPGLRREEVASLAGVSSEYYKRLERGNLAGVSDLVLDALVGALQLDDADDGQPYLTLHPDRTRRGRSRPQHHSERQPVLPPVHVAPIGTTTQPSTQAPANGATRLNATRA